jgi:hypothetical protein
MTVNVWEWLASFLLLMTAINGIESITNIGFNRKPVAMTFKNSLDLMYQDLRSSLSSNLVLDRSKVSIEVLSFLHANSLGSNSLKHLFNYNGTYIIVLRKSNEM